MPALAIMLWPPTAYHWLALALILISIEMMLGTFDLLWISIAAGATALFAALAPEAISAWQGQVVFFAIASTALFILGRTVFRFLRTQVKEHPTLNKRMASTIGSAAVVTTDFISGSGRVRMGDTEWSARSVDGSNLRTGDRVVVDDTDGNALKVSRA